MEKELNKDLEILLQQFSFEELSEEQRAFVLTQITAEEYRAYEFIIKESKAMKEAARLEAPAFIKENLLKELPQKTSSSGKVRQLFNAKVPLWQAAAMLILGFLYLQLSTPQTIIEKPAEIAEVIPPSPQTIYVYQTDTVYKEVKSKPVYIEKIITKEVPVFVSNETTPDSPTNVSDEKPLTDVSISSPNTNTYEDVLEIPANNNVGRNISQDEALMDFLGKVN